MSAVSRDVDRRLRWLCLLLWLLVGLPVVLRPGADATHVAVWALGFVLFGVAMWSGLSDNHGAVLRRVTLTTQVVAVLAMVLTLCDGLEGILLAIVSIQLARGSRPGAAQTWILVQSILLAAAVWKHWSLRPALLLTPPYLGLQLLTYWCAYVLFREARLRVELEGAVAELTATREMLAESARRAERLDISGELHDVIGHRLVALRLNLELLARDVDAPCLDSARTLVQQVHDDVQGIVHLLQSERGIDLQRVLGTLGQVIPRPRIHVHAEDVGIIDPPRAQALFRCCLEVVTNAVKHARADNLWIALQRSNGQLRLTARDDGRGADVLAEGRGLDGTRRRLLELGGTLEIRTSPGRGFRVDACLPSVEGAR